MTFRKKWSRNNLTLFGRKSKTSTIASQKSLKAAFKKWIWGLWVSNDKQLCMKISK